MLSRLLMVLSSLFLLSVSNVAVAAYAVAAAESGQKIISYWVIKEPNIKAAERRAISHCSENAKQNQHTKPCEILMSGPEGSYFAIFHTKDGTGSGFGASSNRQQAIDRAYLECSKRGECPNIAAEVVYDEPAHVATGASCRPQTAQVRCQSRCTNGDCIVEYENGCKMRVQVNPNFDPFTNQWVFPSPAC